MGGVKFEIKRYLKTGDVDIHASAWPGANVLERGDAQGKVLRAALLEALRRRAKGRSSPTVPKGFDVTAFTRKRVRPMVEGFFPKGEQETILDLVQRAVIFLLPENIERILRNEKYDETAWLLANIYLGSLGVAGLDGKHSHPVGMNDGDRCCVSSLYFQETDKFADYVIHESAHIFHNWKRRYAGLPAKRLHEWLLPIAFVKRETFAYACEVYSRIRVLGRSAKTRAALVEEYVAAGPISDKLADWDELTSILRESAAARNGWKIILMRCREQKRQSLAAFMRSTIIDGKRSGLRRDN